MSPCSTATTSRPLHAGQCGRRALGFFFLALRSTGFLTKFDATGTARLKCLTHCVGDVNE